jgi:NADPH:quinone reductase-like Zn-dependent oxidoreductase
MFDTVGLAMDYLSLLRPKTGMIISIATTPSGEQVQTSGMMHIPSKPVVPSYIRILLNMVDKMRKYRASRWNVTYSYLFLDANGKDLDTLRELIEKGSVKPIVGTTANFKDIDEVRKACELVYNGKGGVGKAVITFPEN